MEKSPVIYLRHIQDCIGKIQEYTKDLDEDGFLKNTMIQDAVIRNFEIIGEATKQLNSDFRAKYPTIEWKKIAGMRDKLIHDYIGVDSVSYTHLDVYKRQHIITGSISDTDIQSSVTVEITNSYRYWISVSWKCYFIFN